jgi:nucleoside-diphosphate-sugar epimerase
LTARLRRRTHQLCCYLLADLLALSTWQVGFEIVDIEAQRLCNESGSLRKYRFESEEIRVVGVTGGTGFVGQRVVAQLAEMSSVRVLATTGPTQPVKHVEYMAGDINSIDSVARLVEGCTCIVHLAGVAHSSLRTEAEKLRSYQVNVEGTRKVVSAAIRSGVRRILFVSTSHVYGLRSSLDVEESTPLHASSYYSFTKIEAEKVVLEAAERGIETVIVRPCLIYGPGARFNLERMMRGIDRGYYFHIAGVNPLRSFLSIGNAARALVHLARKDTPTGVYNLADSHPYALVDFANELADRLGRNRPRTIPYAALRVTNATVSGFQRLGLRTPAAYEVIAKLSSDFTVSTARLAQTGFEWKQDSGVVLQEMADRYRRSDGAPCTGQNYIFGRRSDEKTV